MKLKTTKKLAKLLNEHSKYEIKQRKLTELQFQWYVDMNSFVHDADYDYINETYSVLEVTYPPEYYAPQKYITTHDMTEIYNKSSDKSLMGFIEAFNAFIEV